MRASVALSCRPVINPRLIPARLRSSSPRPSWAENPFKAYPIKRYKKKSIQHEIFALNHCDILFTVTNGLMDLFSKKIYVNVKKMMIPNGFDINHYMGKNITRNFTFIYAGSLYNGRDEPFESFLKAIENIEKNIPEIRICIYGSFPNRIKKKYKKMFLTGKIKSYSPVSPRKIYELMHQSFVCLHFNARPFSYAVSTKIYEHAAIKRPTFSVNYGGDIDDLIKKHNFGISVNGDDVGQIENELLELYELWKSDPAYEISPRNLNKFDYKNITEEVVKYLV